MINNFMPIFLACIICLFVVYLSHEHDMPIYDDLDGIDWDEED
jgi:hypothetical protein